MYKVLLWTCISILIAACTSSNSIIQDAQPRKHSFKSISISMRTDDQAEDPKRILEDIPAKIYLPSYTIPLFLDTPPPDSNLIDSLRKKGYHYKDKPYPGFLYFKLGAPFVLSLGFLGYIKEPLSNNWYHFASGLEIGTDLGTLIIAAISEDDDENNDNTASKYAHFHIKIPLYNTFTINKYLNYTLTPSTIFRRDYLGWRLLFGGGNHIRFGEQSGAAFGATFHYDVIDNAKKFEINASVFFK